jgi:hypothetical protein
MKKTLGIKGFFHLFGGSGEIRTHGRLAPTTVFKTVALNHSATDPFKFRQDSISLLQVWVIVADPDLWIYDGMV